MLFTQDKVVPIELVTDTNVDQVMLRVDEGEIDRIPDFEEVHYIPLDTVDETALNASAMPDSVPPRSLYYYPPAGASWGQYPGILGYGEPPYVVETSQNIPDGTVALKQGAKVIATDGEHLGNIERIYADTQVERATHMVVSKGLFFKEKKLIPTNWIKSVEEDEVHLAVKSGMLDKLPDYKEEEI
jgi:hypothetical protein